MNKNQKTFLYMGALILITILVFSAIVYSLDYFRELAIVTLLKKDGQGSIHAKNDFLSAQIGNNTGTTTSTSPTTEAATTTPEVITIPALPTQFEYQLLLDPDPCTINTIGANGWEVSQISTGDLDLVRGLDRTCRKSGSFPTLPWILFVRKS